MNFYHYYQEARNLSWKVLLDCKINKLTVDLKVIADYYNIEIVPYSRSNLIQLFIPEALSGDGFIARINEIKLFSLMMKLKQLVDVGLLLGTN